MRVETKLFYWLLGFFVIVGAIYTYWTGFTEPVGAVGLVLTAIMCGMFAWYLGKTGRTLDARPDDNPEGEINEHSGPYGCVRGDGVPGCRDRLVASHHRRTVHGAGHRRLGL